MPTLPETLQRYRRQVQLTEIGLAGQEKLARASVVLIGCGALGCGIADLLVRGGIGHLRIIDRDIVELSNLHRQTLFDEHDASHGRAKAEAAADRLARINSQVRVEAVVADLGPDNAMELVHQESQRPFDVIADGTDNVQTRYLINDIAVKYHIPWVYGGAVAMQGRVLALNPSRGPCLRCVYPTPPAGNDLATCDTAGILAPAASVVSAIQVAAILQMLVGESSQFDRLLSIDVWQSRFHTMDLRQAKESNCRCCGKRVFEFLDQPAQSAGSLCGRDTVQIRPARRWTAIEYACARDRLAQHGLLEEQAFFARCALRDPSGTMLTLFKDGRVLVSGGTDIGRARAIHDRFIGS